MTTVAIVQARVGSMRLPGKVLSDVGGRPLIERVVRRVSRAKRVDRVVVASPFEATDAAERLWEVLVRLECDRYEDAGYPDDDVLGRYVRCVAWLERMHPVGTNVDVVVRVCGDSPFVDPDVIDDCVELRERTGTAYCGNTRRRTYPKGLCVEAFTVEALREAHAAVERAREHVTPWLKGEAWRSPMSVDLVLDGEDHSHRQWSIDTTADLERVRALYAAVGNDDTVGWRDVLAAAKQME